MRRVTAFMGGVDDGVGVFFLHGGGGSLLIAGAVVLLLLLPAVAVAV